MRRLLPIGILLACAVIAVWWWWPPTDAPRPAALPVAEAEGAAGQSAAPASAEMPVAPAAVPAAAHRDAAPTVAATSGPSATLRGRCVDAQGNPLAGVLASLIGWGANDQRVQAWLADHAEPKRIDEKVTTAADGRFEFRFWPPPPFQFALRLQGAARATWNARWSELAAGATKDLGDIVLAPGTLLRGRVTDSAGQPVANTSVHVEAAVRTQASTGTEQWTNAHTGDDGSFVARWALAAGDYRLGIDEREIERSELVTLSGDPEQSVEIVVRGLVTGGADAISGQVVDQHGAPVDGANLIPSPRLSRRMLTTDRDGRFRVQRPATDAPERIRLSVSCDGYEAVPDQTEFEWGRHDLRLVLNKSRGLEVSVVRADDGTPVEDYLLRVLPISGGTFRSDDQRPRGRSPHAGGRATVDGVRTGEHLVIVEPKGDTFATGMVTATMTERGAVPVVVRLAANTPRVVRVRFADDAPVAGAAVQLVDPLGETLSLRSRIYALSEWGHTNAKKALVLDTGTTDASGEVTLHAPADRPLALYLPGPLHAPLAIASVVFPATGAYVVTVDRGAVLHATVGPASVMAEIEQLAGESLAAFDAFHLPSLYLTAGAGGDAQRFPDLRERCTMAADGTFTLRGIPPGRWDVNVSCFCREKGSGGGNSLVVSVGAVELAAGQQLELPIDLGVLRSSQVSALVLHNGEPLANTEVSLRGELGTGGQASVATQRVTTDAAGRFTTSARGNPLRLSWARQGGQRWSQFQAAEVVVVTPGQTCQATFTLSSGALRVRLLDAAGAPAPQVTLLLRVGAETGFKPMPPTDADGRTAITTDAGNYQIQVLPRALHDPAAMSAFYQANAGVADPLAAVLVTLGAATIRAGGSDEVELRLPADFGR